MSLCEGAKTKVRVDSELSEEFEVKVWMHKGSVFLYFLFVAVVDVVSELAREAMLSELLYADDLTLMGERIEGLGNKFRKRKEPFVSEGWKVDLGKTKVMFIGGIRKYGLCRSEYEPFARWRDGHLAKDSDRSTW